MRRRTYSPSMEIEWLEIGDSPDVWRANGFVVDERGCCFVSGVEHRLVGPVDAASGTDGDGQLRGVVDWGVSGISDDVSSIDGIPTTVVEATEPRPVTPDHPNTVFRIDHLVIRTSDTPRTASALEAVGLSRRGGRNTNSAGDAVNMTFFWAGETLLELAGPPEPKGDSPASIAGIAYANTDLDATVALLGPRSTTPVDAVQAGRRIAALTDEGESSVPTAFMTPHVRSQ